MKILSKNNIEQYRSQGFVIPDFSLSKTEVEELRLTVDELIRKNPHIRPEHIVNAHIATKSAEGVIGAERILELARHPGILDQVEALVGPDIVLWGCQLFCKPAGDGMEVPWHQDGHYWPIRPLATCTVWVAIDDSVISNGCLRVISGSHKRKKLFSHHTDNRKHLALTSAIDDEHLEEGAAVDIELRAGQMSMHDVYLIHGSNKNTSTHRRAGIAIRYMPATSVFRRDIMEPSADSGYLINFSKRPLWLLRGKDQTGQNDFITGHG